MFVPLARTIAVWLRPFQAFQLHKLPSAAFELSVTYCDNMSNTSFAMMSASASALTPEQVFNLYDQEKIGDASAAETMINAFVPLDLVYTLQIDPKMVGVDSSNRQHTGAQVNEVPELVSDIAEIGWNDRVPDPVCIEAEDDGATEDLNVALVKDVSFLAPVRRGDIRFGSLSAGHTNLGLRAIQASATCEVEKLSTNGKYDINKIGSRDPQFAERARHGLTWRVLRKEVRDKYPRALDIISRGKNATNTVGRAAGDSEVLSQMHALASAAQAQNDAPDWARIARIVIRSRPLCIDPWPDQPSCIHVRGRACVRAYVGFTCVRTCSHMQV